MMTSDPIADMLTRIRNANTAKHDTVDVPTSKMKVSIADILVKEGYIKKYDMIDVDGIKMIHITLKYGADKNDKIISGLKRISKPGLRVYAGKEDLPKVLGGLGIAIIQRKDATESDCNTAMILSLAIAFVMYASAFLLDTRVPLFP